MTVVPSSPFPSLGSPNTTRPKRTKINIKSHTTTPPQTVYKHTQTLPNPPPLPNLVLWKITPLFAEWLASPTNSLFIHNVLTPTSLACELGCGISALVALLLAPRIARYVLTDQPYVAKLVEQNLAENNTASSSAAKPAAAAAAVARVGGRSRGRKEAASSSSSGRARIGFAPLDWETDVVTSALAGPGAGSFDVVVACDCIYNEALVEPFVATCVDVCRLRGDGGGAEREEEQQPCVCVVAQQLRDPLIFEAWATRFVRSFHAWRVPDELLVEGLRSSRGFVVHVGVLKGVIDLEAI